MKNKLTIAAIICLIVAGACLIGVLYYAQGMSLSDSGTSSMQTASSATPLQPNEPAALSVSTTGASSSPATPASVHISNVTSAAQAISSANTTAATPGRYIKVLNGITFEVVTTPATQEQGLSGRSNVPNNYAMLFDFPKDGTYGFWMKDMLVPLDMIWVTDSGTIAAVDSDVLPSTYPGVLYPPVPIRYVLETRAGFAQAEGWHVGTVLQLPTV